MFNDENYFSTLSDYTKSVTREHELYIMKENLEIFDSHVRYTKDPNLDRLRRNAKYAIEELHDALVTYNHEEARRLFNKLNESDSDKVINWDNLFKKLGHQ